MSAIDELLSEIRSVSRGALVSYDSTSALSDVYEGYIFSLIVRTASRHGAQVDYFDVEGNPARELVFRTGPGQLYSKRHLYTYARIEFRGAPPLEVHLGVKVQGTSGVLHECDVLILSAEEAMLSRQQGIAPRGHHCILVIECKYYVQSYLQVGLARNFEGLRADVKTHRELFISNTSSSTVAKYLDARKREYERNVVPGASQVGYVEVEIRRAFKSYLSKHVPSLII